MSILPMEIFLLIFTITFMNAVGIHLHMQPEVAIVGYNGPIHKEVMQLLRGAEVLEIKDSNITAMKGHMVSELPKLRKIIFINCTIDVDGVDIETMFHGATHLKEFHASHLKARELHPEIVRTTPLEVYEMTDHDYFPKLPGNLFNETKLKRLQLSRNHIETIEEGAFNGLDKLEILELDTNKIKEIPKSVLVPLKNVKKINLRENRLEKFRAADLPELPKLEKINLGNNPITEIDLDGIEAVAPKLNTIDIIGISMSSEKIAELIAKSPKITFKTE